MLLSINPAEMRYISGERHTRINKKLHEVHETFIITFKCRRYR